MKFHLVVWRSVYMHTEVLRHDMYSDVTFPQSRYQFRKRVPSTSNVNAATPAHETANPEPQNVDLSVILMDLWNWNIDILHKAN